MLQMLHRGSRMVASTGCWWTRPVVLSALLLLTSPPGPPAVADAFFLQDLLQDSVNSTVAHMLGVLGKLGQGFLHPGGAPISRPQRRVSSSFRSTPYPEPPPSSVELCRLRGFRCERHLVNTDDGYVLALIHVIGRLAAPRVVGKVPVLVQHGMLMSSDSFLFRQDNDNLPLFLTDAGYDVWVGNYRGNAVSPHVHRTLDPQSKQFWDFSWHEMGLHDLPALVDFVLEQTEQTELHYIGHSMGSTGMMVLLSSRPEYNAKVRLASFLAPVAYVSKLKSRLFNQLFSIAPQIKKFLVSNGVWNVLPRTALNHFIFDAICSIPGMNKLVCEPIVFEIAGWSPRLALPNLAMILATYLPAGTTIRVMEHYYEVARTGQFRPLGYGMGDRNPGPHYNMSAVEAPVALFYSPNDNFVHIPDVDRLARDLANVVHKYEIPDSSFNHFDFIVASDARRLLFRELLSVMRKWDGDELLEQTRPGEHDDGNSLRRSTRSSDSPS